MNTDPDFHPLAAAWLDGTVTPPEQKVLGEILHNPDLMQEYAALCRTEAMLAKSGVNAARRRAELGRMLDLKPWPRRVVVLWRHRAVRWGAAAALIALCSWWLWPNTANEEAAAKRTLPNTPRIAESTRTGNVSSPAANETPLPPPADGLEQHLRRHYVSGFKTSAPLPEAAAALARAIHPGRDVALTAEVRDSGDAPVHLQLRPSLPAWTLIELMALQSGTEVQLSGAALVFRKSRKAAPLVGTLTRTSELTPLRVLCGDREKFSHAHEFVTFRECHQAALGGDLDFAGASESSARFSGTPRDVKVLEFALNSIANPPVMVSLSMKLVELSPGVEIEEGIIPSADKDGPALSGIFTDEQFQVMMRNIAGIKGVNLLTIPSVLARPSGEVKMQTNPGRRGLVAMLIASPDEAGTCSLHCEMGWGVGLPGQMERDTSGLVNTQVLLFSGQTLGISGFRGQDGSEILAYITATLVQPDGTPLPPLDKAPPSPDSAATPAPPGEVSAPQEELPYGITVPDKPGMVYSPYAPEQGMVDVDGLPRDTRVKCPYTGQLFRVP